MDRVSVRQPRAPVMRARASTTSLTCTHKTYIPDVHTLPQTLSDARADSLYGGGPKED